MKAISNILSVRDELTTCKSLLELAFMAAAHPSLHREETDAFQAIIRDVKDRIDVMDEALSKIQSPASGTA